MNAPSKACYLLAIAILSSGLAACGGGDYQMPWRDQKLPSGKIVKVTDVHLAWGDEHAGRDLLKDEFEMEFVSANPAAPEDARAAEAKDAFELIRPTVELWGMNMAAVSAFPSIRRKGKFDFYVFKRNADGGWHGEHSERKVFSTD